MDDAAVVAGLMRGGCALALDDEHAGRLPVPPPREQFARDGEPEDSRSNDDAVVAVAGHPQRSVPKVREQPRRGGANFACRQPAPERTSVSFGICGEPESKKPIRAGSGPDTPCGGSLWRAL